MSRGEVLGRVDQISETGSKNDGGKKGMRVPGSPERGEGIFFIGTVFWVLIVGSDWFGKYIK